MGEAGGKMIYKWIYEIGYYSIMVKIINGGLSIYIIKWLSISFLFTGGYDEQVQSYSGLIGFLTLFPGILMEVVLQGPYWVCVGYHHFAYFCW